MTDVLAEREFAPTTADTAREIRVFSAAELHRLPIPIRRFHVPGIVPARTVTLLTGDGGTGKSLLALQLSCSTCIGGLWVGQQVEIGRVLYLSAEDEKEECHRRLADIAHELGVELSDFAGLKIVDLAGEDAVLAAPAGRQGIMEATALWKRVVMEVEAHRSRRIGRA